MLAIAAKPRSLADERSKHDFANTARLICIALEVSAAVMILESWMRLAEPGQALDQHFPTTSS